MVGLGLVPVVRKGGNDGTRYLFFLNTTTS